MKAGRTLFIQMWRPLLGLLLGSFIVNALLVTGTLHLGSEAQTELRLARIGEHWATQPPLQQPLALDPVTTLYPSHAQLPGQLRPLLAPEQRGLFELGPRDKDFFVLVRATATGGLLYVVENHAEVKPRDALSGQVISAYLLGIVPFSVLVLWLTRRVAARVAGPMQQIGQLLERGDTPALQPLPVPAGSPVELRALVAQLNASQQRTAEVLERERSFTQFASHELRTPVAVMQTALERLAQRASVEQQPALARAGRGLRDMHALIDTFLALSRDAAPAVRPGEAARVCIDEAWVQALHQHLHGGLPGPALDIAVQGELWLAAPDTVAHVLIGNLLKNALFHGGSGAMQVSITPTSITLRNPLPDTPRPPGHGLGSQIAERICQRFGWQFSLRIGAEEAVADVRLPPSG